MADPDFRFEPTAFTAPSEHRSVIRPFGRPIRSDVMEGYLFTVSHPINAQPKKINLTAIDTCFQIADFNKWSRATI
jgi:hypothetical protein